MNVNERYNKIMNIKVAIAVVCAAFSMMLFGGASSGNCEMKAVGLKSQQTVTLVNAWDSEFNEYWDDGAYYYKVTLSKGSSFSIWMEGGDSENMTLDVNAKESEDDFFMTSFEIDSTDDGIQFARLGESDWDEDDPSEITFIVEITGEIGARATLFAEYGYKTFVPLGSDENPLKIDFAESEKTTAKDFVDGWYHMTAKLTAGLFYAVRTTSGTQLNSVTLLVDTENDDGFVIYDDSAYVSDTNNVAYILSPSVTGTYRLAMQGSGIGFSMVYRRLKSRTPAEHDSIELNSANDYSVTFVPGRRIVSWDYADNIIDEHLSSIYLAKGDRYMFETTGAEEDLHMVVYDSKGKPLVENRSKDGVGKDVRTAIEAESDGTYYVGVCNDSLEPYQTVEGGSVTLTAASAKALDGDPDEWDSLDDTLTGASGLEVLPGTSESSPSVDGALHGPHRLSATDWADNFVIAARAGITYRVGFEFASSEETSKLKLLVEVFTLSGSKEKAVIAEPLDPARKEVVEFTATANQAYYVRCRVAEGKGLDYPAYNVRSVAYSTDGAGLGILTVNTLGANSATWSLDRESVKYPGGSSVLIAGEHTVKFYSVTGFTTPASENITINAGATPTVLNVYYSDKLDPKDDVAKAATSWTLKSTATEQVRTLWRNDPEDNFMFSAKDGQYYSFALENNTGDAVFSITNAEKGVVKENVTSVDKLALAGVKSKYYLTVKHANSEEPQDGSYTLSGFFANVGAIKFAKNAVSAKENAASVKLTINRTAKDGLVRVKYGTVAGTAVPGVDYVAQNGVLEWKDGDNKAKTIEIKFIPDLVAHYEGNKEFSVQLKPFEEDELKDVEYPAQITTDTCVVTLTEVSRAGTTVESTYASKAVKLATVKTENVALETGTFYGVLAEDGFALTNGLPALASVTLTVSTKDPAALSAKVMLAGKTYNFKGTGWESDEGSVRKQTLSLVQKVANVTYTNTLTLAVNSGTTTNGVDWLAGVGSAELVMNVPDANNKGAQEDIRYAGSIYRYNDKVQDYLNVVTNFAGYYTVALAPRGVSVADGIPAGTGYITIKIDNKGGAKIAGKLADAKNSVSISAKACGIIADEESANGYSMYIPLYTAKNPMCFGGELRIFADKESGNLVVDSSRTLVYKNDDPKFTYDNYEGFSMDIEPIGGWYDLLINLQTYYLTMQFAVETADVYELPLEAFTAGYNPVGGTQPTGAEVTLQGDAFATAKKSLVKNGKLYDLEGSINPCNVQVKLARATGLVTGSFSVWSESDDGLKQKEVTGFTHFGVLLPVRDSVASFGSEYAVLGYCTKSFNITNENPDTGKTVKHSWNFSAPFNIFGYDYGDIDWWADDWGINPEN